MFNWVKKGFLYKPNPNLYWQQSHCQNPTIEFINNNVVRIYFSSRDKNNKAYAGFFDYDLNDNTITYSTKDPILVPEFDYERDGVYVSSVLKFGDVRYIYYLGFISMSYGDFTATINLAFWEGNKIKKYKNNPILNIDNIDPFLVTNPTVFKKENMFFMFYTSGIKKELVNNLYINYYTIKIALSYDGIKFEKLNKLIFPLNSNEMFIIRLSILADDTFINNYKYKGFYSFGRKDYPYRKQYRIGFAVSNDLINWIRKDEIVGIDVGPNDYDIDMIAYPQVFKYDNTLFMLYNGNNYGKEGLLLATCNNFDSINIS
jgi:predicted GH43/DUF377 family glycosyl hydrolase